MSELSLSRINRSIRLVYAMNFAWAFLIIQAIMVPLYTSKGLTSQQIISIATVFSLTLLLLDIPTGLLADIFSRRAALIGAGLFKGLGGTTLVFWQSYPGFIVSFVLIGIGNSLLSGADLALLSQLNTAKGDRAESMTHLLSSRLSMSLTGAGISAMLAGVIGSYSFQVAIDLNCIVAWTSLLIAVFIEEPAHVHPHESGKRPDLRKFAFSIIGSASNLRLVFLTRVGLLTILQIHASILQIFWQELHIPLVWFGLLSAAHSLLGAGLSHLLVKRKIPIQFRLIVWLVAALPVAGFLGSSLGAISVLLGIGSGFLFEAYRAIVGSRMNAFFNTGLPANLLATGNSCASMGSRLGFVLISPIISIAIKNSGVLWTMAGLGVASALFSLLAFKLSRIAENPTKMAVKICS